MVLPLVLEGAADDAGWFADALHGDFIIALARLQGAFVIARDTAATYAGRAVEPRQVARELGVRHVVRGRLRPEGPVLRLSLALIDGDSGVQRWTEAFVLERAELPQRLAELAIRMVRELQPELLRSVIAQRAALSPLEVTADDLAMRASAIWFRDLHADNIVEALKLLDRAVALDPNSMRGWGCIDFMLLHGLYHGWLTDRQAVLARIEEASAQIERLDQNHYYAHMARGINAFLRRDWAAMLRAATAWTAMYDHPGAHAGRGLALMLNGRPDESVEELERALRLAPRDPLVADWQYRLAFAHFMAGRLEQACEWAQTAAMSNPSLPGPRRCTRRRCSNWARATRRAKPGPSI